MVIYEPSFNTLLEFDDILENPIRTDFFQKSLWQSFLLYFYDRWSFPRSQPYAVVSGTYLTIDSLELRVCGWVWTWFVVFANFRRVNNSITVDFRLPAWHAELGEEMSTGSSYELEPADFCSPLAPRLVKPHLKAVLYRLELIALVGYLIYIYVAKKEFLRLLNIFEKHTRITAKIEQNNNYNIYHCLRSVWHLLIKLLSRWNNLQGFALLFPFCQPIILMTKILSKHSQEKTTM